MNKFYLVIIVSAFFSALSQILLNISAAKTYKSKIYEYMNPWVIASYGILFCVLITNIYCMRYVSLKNAHALVASTYAFVLILSSIFLKEKITKKKVIGNIILIAGIIVFVQ